MGVDAKQMLEQLRSERDAKGLLDELRGREKIEKSFMANVGEVYDKMLHGFVVGGAQMPGFSEIPGPGELTGVAARLAAGTSVEDEVKRAKGDVLAFSKGFVNAGEGVAQLSLEAMEKIGALPKGTATAFTKKTDAERQQFARAFQEEFGDDLHFKLQEVKGTLVPSILIGRVAPTGSTVMRQIAAGGATGAAFGAAQFVPSDEKQSRLFNTLTGLGLGAGFTAMANALPAIRSKIVSFVGKSLKSPTAKKGMDLVEKTRTPLKLSQITDDPFIEDLERIVARGGFTKEPLRKIQAFEKESFRKSLAFWRRTTNAVKGGKGNFGDRLGKAFDKTLGSSSTGEGLLGARAKQAAIDYAAVNKASEGASNIPVTNFVKRASTLIDEGQSSASIAKRRLAKNLQVVVKEIKEGKVTGKKLQDLLRTYGDAAKGRGRPFSDKIDPSTQTSTSKALFKSLSQDLDKAAAGSQAGAKELKVARDNYKAFSQQIDKLRESAMFNVFNGKVPKSVEAIEDAIARMRPSQLKQTMTLLEKADPELHSGLQRFWLERHLRSTTKAVGEPRFDPKKALALADDGKFLAIFKDKAVRKQVLDGIRLNQRIIKNLEKAVGDPGSLLQKAAGVAASQDRTFVARLLTELATPQALSRYVTSPEGVKALQQLVKTNSVNEAAGALISLNDLRKRFDREDETIMQDNEDR